MTPLDYRELRGSSLLRLLPADVEPTIAPRVYREGDDRPQPPFICVVPPPAPTRALRETYRLAYAKLREFKAA